MIKRPNLRPYPVYDRDPGQAKSRCSQDGKKDQRARGHLVPIRQCICAKLKKQSNVKGIGCLIDP